MKRKRALQGCNHRRGITWWGLIRADVGSAGESNSNLALPPPSHFSPHRTNRPPHALKILLCFSRALKHPLVGAAPPCALAGFAGQSFPTHRSVGSRHQTGTIFPAECGPVHSPAASPARDTMEVVWRELTFSSGLPVRTDAATVLLGRLVRLPYRHASEGCAHPQGRTCDSKLIGAEGRVASLRLYLASTILDVMACCVYYRGH